MVKNSVKIIVCSFLLLMLCSCNDSYDFLLGYDVSDFVSLADYKNISIESEYIKVTDDEIKTVIEADLDSRGIYKEIVDRDTVKMGDIVLCDIISEDESLNHYDYYYFTDSSEFSEDITQKLICMNKGETLIFETKSSDGKTVDMQISIKGIYAFADAYDSVIVPEMYGCKNIDEAITYARDKTEKTIILNYVLNKLIEESIIKEVPRQADEYVEKCMEATVSEMEKDGISNMEEYLGMTADEYEEYNYGIYFEYMLYVAIAQENNILFNEEDFDETVSNISDEEKIPKQKVLELYGREYIVYETIVDEVEELLISYVTVN